MVAKISTGQSIRGMLHYNENKVSAKEAKLILSSGFAGETRMMSFQMKLQRFHHLTELKPNVKTNAVHISLNFHSSENLENLKLQQIAISYMERIGFADQPFLVYRHDDAAHQHLHITTTNITPDGKRIDLHDIGKLRSEPARNALEIEYGLVKAESTRMQVEAGIKQADPEKAKYGKLPTKRALSNVVAAVSRDYRFTSLAEYNAVLKCFNVVALRGAEHTTMFEKKGLMYSLLDKNGKQVGVPIKSSAFFCKATLRNLEKKFVANLEKRKVSKEDLKQRISKVLQSEAASGSKQFKVMLSKHGVQVSFRENELGRVYGITFIDHKNKTVFNGSDLGKDFSAKAVTERINRAHNLLAEGIPKNWSKEPSDQVKNWVADTANPSVKQDQLLDILLTKNLDNGSLKVPKQKKKRRKKQISIQENNI